VDFFAILAHQTRFFPTPIFPIPSVECNHRLSFGMLSDWTIVGRPGKRKPL
jgi:hypothetical protein